MKASKLPDIVYVQILAGRYFHKFCESVEVCEVEIAIIHSIFLANIHVRKAKALFHLLYSIFRTTEGVSARQFQTCGKSLERFPAPVINPPHQTNTVQRQDIVWNMSHSQAIFLDCHRVLILAVSVFPFALKNCSIHESTIHSVMTFVK